MTINLGDGPLIAEVEVVSAFPDYWQDPNIPSAMAKVKREKTEAAKRASAQRIAEEKAKICLASAQQKLVKLSN